MLTVNQAATLRAAVKAAPKGDPLHTAYRAGDGKNRCDVWTPLLDEGGTPVVVDGVEQREQGEPTFTDAGGDIDAILAHYSTLDDRGRRVWLSTVRSAALRSAIDLDELVGSGPGAQAKASFVLGGDLADLTVTATREALTGLGPKSAEAIATVGTRPATRLDALDLNQAGAHHVSGFPLAVTRVDVFDALYEQQGDTVAKR